MRANTTSALLVLLMLAAPAIGEDVPAVQPPPAPPAAEAPIPLPPAEPPVEVLSPAQATGDAVTFDSMESIPFENAVEPPDEPPPLDNTLRAPGLDNTVPRLPGMPAMPDAAPVPGIPATPGIPPAPGVPATPGIPPVPPAPDAAAPPPPPVNLRAQ